LYSFPTRRSSDLQGSFEFVESVLESVAVGVEVDHAQAAAVEEAGLLRRGGVPVSDRGLAGLRGQLGAEDDRTERLRLACCREENVEVVGVEGMGHGLQEPSEGPVDFDCCRTRWCYDLLMDELCGLVIRTIVNCVRYRSFCGDFEVEEFDSVCRLGGLRECLAIEQPVLERGPLG